MKIMTFNEFVQFLDSEDSRQERIELESFFTEMREKNNILTYKEWSAIPDRRFLFLAYDLIDTKNHPNLYNKINTYISQQLGFSRDINGRQLTNNSFVSFPSPLNQVVLYKISHKLTTFFSGHLPQFRLYLNITSDTEFYLHP